MIILNILIMIIILAFAMLIVAIILFMSLTITIAITILKILPLIMKTRINTTIIINPMGSMLIILIKIMIPTILMIHIVIIVAIIVSYNRTSLSSLNKNPNFSKNSSSIFHNNNNDNNDNNNNEMPNTNGSDNGMNEAGVYNERLSLAGVPYLSSSRCPKK